jgi:hypothetical protein
MSGAGHFRMVEDSDGFNRLREEAVQKCTQLGGSWTPLA